MICSRCKVDKPNSDFAPSCVKRGNGWCRDCFTDYYRIKNNVKNPRVDLPNGNRVCGRCKKEKTIECFTKGKNCKNGRERTCKECTNRNKDKYRDKINYRRKQKHINDEVYRRKVKESASNYYQKNIEERRAYGRKHAKENPEIYKAANHRRRAKKRSNGNNNLNAKQVKSILDNGICEYCGIATNLTIDHVIPISKGGQNTVSNVVAACSTCNNKKRANIW